MTEQTEALENIEMEFSSLLNWLTQTFHDSQVSSDPRDMHRRIGMTMDKVKVEAEKLKVAIHQQAARIAELEAEISWWQDQDKSLVFNSEQRRLRLHDLYAQIKKSNAQLARAAVRDK